MAKGWKVEQAVFHRPQALCSGRQFLGDQPSCSMFETFLPCMRCHTVLDQEGAREMIFVRYLWETFPARGYVRLSQKTSFTGRLRYDQDLSSIL